jgi:Adenylate and Guanylate cyclase catalytic domain
MLLDADFENGGFVAKYMGDGVLAYFGYPQAREHDAEYAVRAGLTIVEVAPKLNTAAGAALDVRVGIATGVVVVAFESRFFVLARQRPILPVEDRFVDFAGGIAKEVSWRTTGTSSARCP